MRYFLDTEFLDTDGSTQLISLGMVSAAGQEFYAISSDYDTAAAAADPWLSENVLPHLCAPGAPAPMPNSQIAEALTAWCSGLDDGRTPEVWAWNGAYDFYLLAKLYGRLVNIPALVPRRFFDLKQWARSLGNVSVPAQAAGEHDALCDARHDRATFAWLAAYERDRDRRRVERMRGKVLDAVRAVRL